MLQGVDKSHKTEGHPSPLRTFPQEKHWLGHQGLPIELVLMSLGTNWTEENEEGSFAHESRALSAEGGWWNAWREEYFFYSRLAASVGSYWGLYLNIEVGELSGRNIYLDYFYYITVSTVLQYNPAINRGLISELFDTVTEHFFFCLS